MLTEYQGRAGPVQELSDGDLIERSLADPACFAAIFGRHRRAGARQLRLLRSVPAERADEDMGGRAAERVTAEQLRPRVATCVTTACWTGAGSKLAPVAG